MLRLIIIYIPLQAAYTLLLTEMHKPMKGSKPVRVDCAPKSPMSNLKIKWCGYYHYTIIPLKSVSKKHTKAAGAANPTPS